MTNNGVRGKSAQKSSYCSFLEQLPRQRPLAIRFACPSHRQPRSREISGLSLHHLLVGRGDVAVITKSYLNRYLMKQPKDKSKLLVSDRMDQVYEHTAVVKKGSRPSAQDIDALLTAMEKAGVLKPLWANYGLGN